MKIALPVWQGRVSPVFDVARKLLVIVFAGGVEVSRTEEELVETLLPCRAARLSALQVDTLLCGAVSRPLAAMIYAAGIRVVPFLSGDADRALKAFLAGHLNDPLLRMPGFSSRSWEWLMRSPTRRSPGGALTFAEG